MCQSFSRNHPDLGGQRNGVSRDEFGSSPLHPILRHDFTFVRWFQYGAHVNESFSSGNQKGLEELSRRKPGLMSSSMAYFTARSVKKLLGKGKMKRCNDAIRNRRRDLSVNETFRRTVFSFSKDFHHLCRRCRCSDVWIGLNLSRLATEHAQESGQATPAGRRSLYDGTDSRLEPNQH